MIVFYICGKVKVPHFLTVFSNAFHIRKNKKKGTRYTVNIEILDPFYFHPFRPSWQWANIRLGEFQCLMLSFFKHNCV